ncbi:rolling circle replication-associated protein [Anaerotruncus massiliensis (ex Liu et al. 2021)]|uniref:rolling circle replication-associated protein n=1 Tax=Anaerotruncus massiliensis (ex Liu et al. 2021) TaxID=2321404 RepID=UPI003AF56710
MAYMKRRVVTGSVIEVRKYQTLGSGEEREARPRGQRVKPTPDEMFRTNERNAERKLRWILNTNFGGGDLHVTLKFRKGRLPPPDEARRQIEKFLRALRSFFTGQGGPPLRYVLVAEHVRSNIHFHLVIPACDIKELRRLWMDMDPSHSWVNVSPLDDSGQYKELAHYLIKETSGTFRDGTGLFKKRWNESRNLVHPKPRTEKVKARQWRADPTPEKGYLIERDSVRTGVNPFTGLVWQEYSMIRVPDTGKKRPPVKRRC